MSNLESMYQAVQFIEHHLKEPVSVKDVADSVNYSLYHFSRTFSSVIRHSPYDYIIRRRLSESAKDLIESGKKIVDIAFEYQFNSPETYSRAFRRMFDVLPSQAKKTKSIANLILKSEITLEYIRHINTGNYLKPEFVELDAIHLVGLVSLVRGHTGLITELWEKFSNEIESIPNRLKPEKHYGISFSPLSWEAQECFYMVSVEVDSLDIIPPALVGKTIQPLKYAKFIHKGLSKDVGMTFDYIYQTWLPRAGSVIAAPFKIELQGQGYKGPNDPDSESEILIPITVKET